MMQDQMARLISCQSFFNDQRAAALQALDRDAGGTNRYFLSNSGAEAIEAALKFAIVHAGRRKIVGPSAATMGGPSALGA